MPNENIYMKHETHENKWTIWFLDEKKTRRDLAELSWRSWQPKLKSS